MTIQETILNEKKVTFYLDTSLTYIENILDKKKIIIITDENIFNLYKPKIEIYKHIVIQAGEASKIQNTINEIVEKLIQLQADKNTFLLGIGGGVITDITGFVASIFMRGISFSFVPTSLLAMVDAAIGGKNGINQGKYKNMLGTINQPQFILYDYSFLNTLPHQEWVNGFAEIIKHACIKDEHLFDYLEKNDIPHFQQNQKQLFDIIEKNIQIKTNIVISDVAENGDRKLLNFGHTFGHALENLYQLTHGHAISIGMVLAAKISEEINNFYTEQKDRLIDLLKQYELPTNFEFDKKKVFEILKMDKKKNNEAIQFILLNKIGEAIIFPISFIQIEDLLNQFI